GRQPWIAHGILRTADAISPVSAASVLTTLILFIIVYGIVFSMGLYYINRLIVRGPQGRAVESSRGAPGRPLSSAHDAAREAMQPGGGDGMVSPGDLDCGDRRRRRALCDPRRLRSRHRHPVSLRQGGQGARPDDRVDRA